MYINSHITYRLQISQLHQVNAHDECGLYFWLRRRPQQKHVVVSMCNCAHVCVVCVVCVYVMPTETTKSVHICQCNDAAAAVACCCIVPRNNNIKLGPSDDYYFIYSCDEIAENGGQAVINENTIDM